jgi:hypothetical protein
MPGALQGIVQNRFALQWSGDPLGIGPLSKSPIKTTEKTVSLSQFSQIAELNHDR